MKTDINLIYIVIGARGFGPEREFFVATWRRSREEAEEVARRLGREAAALKVWDEEYRRLHPISYDDAARLLLWRDNFRAAMAAVSEGYLYCPNTATRDDPPDFVVHECDRARVGTDGWVCDEALRPLEELLEGSR